MAREERPTGAYYAGIAGAAGGFELGRLGYRQAFVSPKNETGPKMKSPRLGQAMRNLRAGKFKAAAARTARGAKTIKSGIGAKAMHGLKFGAPGIAAGLVGSVALGSYLQNKAARGEANLGVRSVTEPKEGNWTSVGRLVGGFAGGIGGAAAIGSKLASRHWATRIGASALAAMGASAAGDWAGGMAGRRLDRYQASTRRRIAKACFDIDEPLQKAFWNKGRDGDGDGRTGDGTPQETAAQRAKAKIGQKVGGAARHVRELLEPKANDVIQGARRDIKFLGAAPLESKAQLVVERALTLLARIEGATGVMTPGIYGDSLGGGGLDQALEMYAPKAGLDARKIVRTVKDHRRMRVLVRTKIRAAKKLIGLVKDGWDEDTLALAWMAREGLASPGQVLELSRRLR